MLLNMQELVSVFLAEGRELTDYIEQTLLSLEQQPEYAEQEQVNALFRAAHTIKGSAGVVGLNDVVAFTHLVESAFESVRAGIVKLSPPLIANLLLCKDHINQLFEFAEMQQITPETVRNQGQKLLFELTKLVNAEDPAAQAESDTVAVKDQQNWHVFVSFAVDTFRDGFDPLAIVRFIAGKGQISGEFWHAQKVPLLVAGIDADTFENCYLELDLMLSNTTASILDEAFEYVSQESRIAFFVSGSYKQDYDKFLHQLDPEAASRIGARWHAMGLWPEDESNQLPPPEVSASIAEPLSTSVPKATPSPITRRDTTSGKESTKDQRLMRVPAFRLDELVNQLGELVIATAALQTRIQHYENSQLSEAVEHIQQLVDNLQSSALQLRMVQIGETFSRFNRVVRDLATELGKDIKLEILGAETELDKSMVERISDPLMHLVRNAIDHGLELPQERRQAGKAEQGVLQLAAYHDSGSIVIEIKDDGRGINRVKVRDKAIAKGLISHNAELTDSEIDELIFAAGFSTADTVSNLSGRGVGMDVVRKNIEALRGTVHIHSVPGKGSTFQLRLPLTLAIIDGFMVRVAESVFVIPLNLVTECLELPTDLDHGNSAAFMSLRGEMLPFIFLNRVFNLSVQHQARRSIIVVRYGQHRAGLVVDQVLGEFQTVIKPLGKLFEFMHGVSGSSILGSGDIALILDIPRLLSKYAEKSSATKSHCEVTK